MLPFYHNMDLCHRNLQLMPHSSSFPPAQRDPQVINKINPARHKEGNIQTLSPALHQRLQFNYSSSSNNSVTTSRAGNGGEQTGSSSGFCARAR